MVTLERGADVKSTTRKWLRSPRERVGTLSHADLPPPLPTPRKASAETLLLRALRDGDEAAFERLLDRWYSPMLRVARSYVRTDADAEEAVQETWLAVLRGIDTFEGRGSLKTGVFRILANRARSLARREARSVPMSDLAVPANAAGASTGEELEWLFLPERTGPLEWHGNLASGSDPDEELAGRELQARIEAAIRELPPRQQQVITLRDLEGWSAEEVCEALDLSDGNQRVLLHRARTKIRDAIFAEA